MYSEVIESLLAIGEYTGTEAAFLKESATRIQGVLKCSPKQAERTLQELREHGEIDFELTPGGELPPTPHAIPVARWYWHVPPAA